MECKHGMAKVMNLANAQRLGDPLEAWTSPGLGFGGTL